MDDAFQWLGFVGVCGGALAFKYSNRVCSLLTFLGSVCLLAWSCRQVPIPWGVAGVQLLCACIWACNFLKEI